LTIGDNSELQIIHATEEQLLKLQQSHQIQILDDNQVSAELLQQFQGPNRVISVSVAPSVDDPPPVTSDVIEYEDHSSQLQVRFLKPVFYQDVKQWLNNLVYLNYATFL